MGSIKRVWSRAVALTAGVGLVLACAVVTTSPAQAASAPRHLRAAEVAAQAIGLTWDGTSQAAYRVRMSTHRDMAGAKSWDVVGNYLEWTNLNPNPDKSSSRLTPGKTYYFQVKAITSKAKPTSLTSYGSTLAVKTSKKASPELKPVDLSATAASTSMYLSWRSRGPGVRYLVRYSTTLAPSVTRWQKAIFDEAGGTLTGLQPDTRYYFRVRVLDAAGAPLSAYSTKWKAATRTTSPAIRVLSYNVNKVSNAGHPWEQRRDAVAANILAQAPDVVGLQEASPLTVVGADATPVTQYDDLLQRLGSPYELATRKGSSGTKLAYNASRLSVVDASATSLTTLGTATRYAVWAIFKDKQTGGKFFVLNTHLEPGSSSVAEYNVARATQAEEVLKLIADHSEGLPVVLQGDFNSARTAVPNAPYVAFTAAGFVDPTGNSSASFLTGRNATAEHVVNAAYNSYNGYETKARRTSFPVGTYIDYILTDPRIRVAEFRTVVDLNRKGQFVGTIPSDHNAIVATIELPS
ncbi:endonuclease/exonuclease/phosphatase family protein [Propionicimonas sp.]|uniref:endonuclease/exonuclease/phosphatase family protein n=1 Tax=Propionicimonas sp. TaxID=1955623 RepID=UPI0039E2D8CD